MHLRSVGVLASLLLSMSSAACSSGNPSAAADTSLPAVPLAAVNIPRMPASDIDELSLYAAVTANNAFALDLYAQLRAQPSASTSNVLTTPVSASFALTMAYAGANGQTAEQMVNALHFAGSEGLILEGQNALSQGLASRALSSLAGASGYYVGDPGPFPVPSSPGDYQLQVVNATWGEKTYAWGESFLDALALNYGSGVYQVDLTTDTDPARRAIDAWIGTQTNDAIQNLLPAGSLDAATRIVLVNATYLKLPWATTFAASRTAAASFTTGAGATVSPSFMHASDWFGYRDDGTAQSVGLQLAGGELAVVITVPRGDLATYEAALTPTSSAVTMPGSASLLELSVPKLSFTSPSTSLAVPLRGMGMIDAFTKGTADFEVMCPHPADGAPVYLGDVVQKSTIAMTESGVGQSADAPAAATTSASNGVADAGVVTTPITMNVNKPFLVSVIDLTTGAILYLGHIEDPTNAGSP